MPKVAASAACSVNFWVSEKSSILNRHLRQMATLSELNLFVGERLREWLLEQIKGLTGNGYKDKEPKVFWKSCSFNLVDWLMILSWPASSIMEMFLLPKLSTFLEHAINIHGNNAHQRW